MNEFYITIDGVDVTRYAVYPFNFQFTLDVGLDQAFVELRNTSRVSAYPAFSLVKITIGETEPTLYYISVDNCIVNQKTGKADHKILLIEETKILERVICRAKTFVEPLVKNYTDQNTSVAEPIEMDTGDVLDIYESDRNFYASKIITPSWTSGEDYRYYTETYYYKARNIPALYVPGEKIYFSSVFELDEDISFSSVNIYNKYIEIRDSLNNRISYMSYTESDQRNPDPNVSVPTNGAFTVYVFANMDLRESGGSLQYYNFATSYVVSGVNQITLESSPLYITDCVTKLLDIAEPIRMNIDSPRFMFDTDAATKYSTTPCAEFNFANGATLWENLLEIARTVQCIPRLKNNKVYFDDLGSAETLTEGVFGTPISQTSDITSEKFASHLDSVVNGLMNLENEEQGAISDPFDNGFRTIRSEISATDYRTVNDEAFISTVSSIEKITKVTVYYNGETKDITPYVYEKNEYDLLYSNEGSYPFAKAYALYYVQGQPNIYGLQYKVKNGIGAFNNFAIENILNSVGVSVAWDADLFDLAFNVEYITAINGRVRQAKKNVDDLQTLSVIAFNQSANRLSSVNYGKRLKGEIAMMGSAEVKLVFKTKATASKWNAIRSAAGKGYPGDTYGKNMYISDVTAKMWRDYFLVELGLTKNFNQLGRFVGINSAVRQFEIDTNVSESYMVWEDYAVIGSAPFELSGQQSPSFSDASNLERIIADSLVNSGTGFTKATLARVTTFDYDNTVIGTFLLPVQSVSLGNSILFNFRFEDNYSAGKYLTNPIIGVNTNDPPYKLTQLARYGDPIYGEVKSMHISIYSNTSVDPGKEISVGDVIPMYGAWDDINKVRCIASTSNPIIIHKSSRDAINFTYQLHFVTTDDYIFGNFVENNPLVGGHLSGAGAKCYFYNARLNVMDGTTPGGQYHEVLDVDYDVNNAIKVDVGTNGSKLPNADYVSWCIRDAVTGETILGGNGKLPSDGRIYIRTTHKLN